MHFRTILPIFPQTGHLFDQTKEVMLLGSCFSENMKKHFTQFGFKARSNPFGVLFNPLSIQHHIENSVRQKPLPSQSIVETNMGFTSLLVHSSFNAPSKEALNKKYTETITALKERLSSKPNVIIITLGTAWIYEHLESQIVCANCHKIPQSSFKKRLLTQAEIAMALKSTVALLKTLNPNNQVIFTLSPVRHIKDGFIENMQSKSLLYIGIQNGVAEEGMDVTYFPAFELMMDELRDYRFYKRDMLHPNKQAINYIWEKFKESYFAQITKQTGDEIAKYYQLKQHRVLSNSTSVKESHSLLLKKLSAELVKKYPHLYLKME